MSEKAKIITLENGLRIVCEFTDRVRTCSMGIWVASGSAYETPLKWMKSAELSMLIRQRN